MPPLEIQKPTGGDQYARCHAVPSSPNLPVGTCSCAGILPSSFAKHHNRIMIFVPGACPVVSPPRNGLWYTPHAASVHTPAAPSCPVRNAARPELSDLRTGLPGLDRPGPPPDCHPGEALVDGVRSGLAGGVLVVCRTHSWG